MRWRIGLVAAILGVLAGPAIVAATTTPQYDTVGAQEYVSTGAHSTIGTSWQPVPGLTLLTSTLHGPVTVSASLTKGQAMFRVLSSTSKQVAQPGKVRFTSPGAEAFTFFNSQNCQAVQVQWKPVGKTSATLAKASVHAIFAGQGCG